MRVLSLKKIKGSHDWGSLCCVLKCRETRLSAVEEASYDFEHFILVAFDVATESFLIFFVDFFEISLKDAIFVSLNDEILRKCQISSLRKIRDSFPKFLLTMDYDEAMIDGIKKINVIDWLLALNK